MTNPKLCADLHAAATDVADRVAAICTPKMLKLEMSLTGETENDVRERILKEVGKDRRRDSGHPSQQRGH